MNVRECAYKYVFDSAMGINTAVYLENVIIIIQVWDSSQRASTW